MNVIFLNFACDLKCDLRLNDLNEVEMMTTIILHMFEHDETNHLLMLFEFVN